MRGWLFLCAALLVGMPAFADPFVYGVTDFPRQVNTLTGTHPVAWLVRSAVTEALLSSDGQLRAADSIQISADAREWRLRISRGGAFHSGRPVRFDDVAFSVGRCPEVSQGWEIAEEQIADSSWVVFRRRPVAEAEPRDLAKLLAECPLVERESSLVFGAELGEGASFVGSGDYAITGYRVGREIGLERQYRRGGGRGGPSDVVIRTVPGAEHGLTALRAGTIDVLLTPENAVIAKAAGDDTLRQARCQGLTAVFRARLHFSCERVSENEYVG